MAKPSLMLVVSSVALLALSLYYLLAEKRRLREAPPILRLAIYFMAVVSSLTLVYAAASYFL